MNVTQTACSQLTELWPPLSDAPLTGPINRNGVQVARFEGHLTPQMLGLIRLMLRYLCRRMIEEGVE